LIGWLIGVWRLL